MERGAKNLFIILIFVLATILLSVIVWAVGSENYNITSPTESDGAGNSSSANYQTGIILGEITGNLSSAGYLLNLGFWYSAIINPAPSITLIFPTNNTGDSDGNVTFNYNVTDTNNVTNCSLIINDNINQTDTSITKSVTQNFTVNNLAAGNYVWSINCTDGLNVNNSEDRILSVALASVFSGNTTDLSTVNISNISNLIVERPSYGMINFTEIVDLSGGGNVNGHVNISFNKIEINSSALPALNKSARLILRDLTFSNPRILRDGAACPSTICTKESYVNNTLTFSVTQFSVYSGGETPSPGSEGSGGGIGGSSSSRKETERSSFSVNRDIIKSLIKQGEHSREDISVTNLGENNIRLRVELTSLEDYVIVKEDAISLGPHENKEIKLDIFAGENEPPDIHTGRLIIKSGDGVSEFINIIVEVKEKKPLFDIITDIQERSLTSDGKLKTNITVINMGDLEHIDVVVYYAIKNFDNEVLWFKEESLAIEKELKIEREFELPEDLLEDKYILYSRVSYGNITAMSSDVFTIESKKSEAVKEDKKYMPYLWIVLILCLLIALIILFFTLKRRRKKKFDVYPGFRRPGEFGSRDYPIDSEEFGRVPRFRKSEESTKPDESRPFSQGPFQDQ